MRNFGDWTSLRAAGFPAYETPAGERPADWRTDAERTHDRNRAYMDATSGMDAMFPLSEREIQRQAGSLSGLSRARDGPLSGLSEVSDGTVTES